MIAIPEVRRKQPHAPGEIAAYNCAIIDFIEILEKCSGAVFQIGRRPIHEGFAATALEGMAHAGRALLIFPPEGEPPMPENGKPSP